MIAAARVRTFGLGALVAWMLALAGAVAVAQTTPTEPPVQPGPSAQGVAAQRARLEAVRVELDQLETGLDRRSDSDVALQQMRALVEPLADQARAIIVELTPRADAARSRLKELGPKPDDKAPPESAEATREREERQAALTEIEEPIRIARSLLVQAEQIQQSTADRRRALFAKRLFESSQSLLSPTLWSAVWQSLPREIAAFSLLAGDLRARAASQLSASGGLVLFWAVVIALILILPLRRILLRFVKRDRHFGEPDSLQRAIAATFVTLGGTLGPAIAGYVLYQLIDGLNLLPPRMVPVFGSVVSGAVFIMFVHSLFDGLLAPGRNSWRVFMLTNERAEGLVAQATLTAAILVAGSVTEALFQSMAAGLPLSLATRGLFALAVALSVAQALRMIRLVDPEDEAALGPHVARRPDYSGLIRTLGWIVVAFVCGALMTGYVALAWFLSVQMVWAALIASVLTLTLSLVDEGVTATFGETGRTSRILHASVGLSMRSLQQFGVLVAGLLRLALFLFAALLLLAPWGVESGDIMASLRALVFGLTIGGMTLSLSTVLGAVVLLAGGVLVTRGIQRWLKTRYFPYTELDAGLRNSITTGLGYLGMTLAFAASVSYLGLSLDRLTIVVGALSVGIGLGLQSIVNNFVSGLILLAERSIRVGDWIVVGPEQGYVRRINVRSTEIETFDRATLIVPNSSLVSGTVKNWVHSDRSGRFIITIPVPRDVDADSVAAILRDVASENPDLLEDPAPRVLFKSISESALTFDLIAFVGEIDTSTRVASDLTFVVYRRLREAGIVRPAGPTMIAIDGIAAMRDELSGIRRRLGLEEGSAGEGGDDAPPAPQPSRPQESPG